MTTLAWSPPLTLSDEVLHHLQQLEHTGASLALYFGPKQVTLTGARMLVAVLHAVQEDAGRAIEALERQLEITDLDDEATH